MRMYHQVATDFDNRPELKDTVSHKMYEDSRNKVKKETRTLGYQQLLSAFLNHAGGTCTYHRNIGEMEREFINGS